MWNLPYGVEIQSPRIALTECLLHGSLSGEAIAGNKKLILVDEALRVPILTHKETLS